MNPFTPIHEGIKYSWQQKDWLGVIGSILIYPFMALYNWAAQHGF